MNPYLLLATVFAYLPLAAVCLLLLQQNGYQPPKKKSFWVAYIITSIFVAIATVLSCIFSFFVSVCIFAALELLTMAVWVLLYFKSRGRVKFTKRMLRLSLVSAFIYAGAVVAILLLAPQALVAAMLLAVPATLIASVVLYPIEEQNNRRYHKKLKVVLDAAPALIRIGITGSAGKTSVKNILYQMLSVKFNVLVTDKNYNTPLGLYLSVKDKNLADHDIFIAEMGARKQGDIKELCALVSPDAAIITSVLPQHLETFYTLQAVRDEKAELARSVVSGIVVLNADDQNVRSMAEDTLGEVLAVGDGRTYSVQNLQADYRGTQFTLTTPIGDVFVKTDLLGAHTAKNIALAVALSLRLGISKDDIEFAVQSLKATPHRLEMLKNKGNIWVLDDGYNANVAGAENALQIVDTFPGRRVVFSQGIVELGAEEADKNTQLGKKIADVADVLVITGRLGDYIYEGAKDSDVQIVRVKDVKAAGKLFKTLLQPGDLLYLQNDLPEMYR